MSTRTPPDYLLIKRIMEECAKYGGPLELARQLSLNKDLEERNHELQMLNDSLTRTRDSILERIQQFQGQEAEALKRRDDLLEEAKALDREVTSKKSELEEVVFSLAQKLNAKKDWEAIQQRMEEELAKLNLAIISCKKTLAPAYWVRSILETNRPILFDLEKEYIVDFLNAKQPASTYNDETGHRIIDFLIDELTRRGTLVPRILYDIVRATAALWANRIREIGRTLDTFVRAPEKMTTEQRRMLLVGFAEAGLNSQDKFGELLKQAAEVETQCPIHHNKMNWVPAQLKWICPAPNCNFFL